jgi:hypothetical protein
MERETITRQELALLMVKRLKEWQKAMGDATNKVVPLGIANWGNRRDGRWYWTTTEINVGKRSFEFKDRQIDDEEFINMVNKALADSGVRGHVKSMEFGYGYSKEVRFEDVEILARPFKEFTKLTNMLLKYSGKGIGAYDIYSVNICGKRNSWSDSGRMRYLCYDAKKCNAIMEFIKKHRTSRDKVTISVNSYMDKGELYDYAMRAETEWYGVRGVNLSVTITTPTGKVKATNEWAG